MKPKLASALALGLLVSSAFAQDKLNLTNRTQRISYALGADVVRVLKIDDFDIDMKAIAAGMEDMQAGKPAMTREEQRAVLKEMQEYILNKAVAKKEAEGEVHRKEGAAFLAANAKKEGVKIKEVTGPDGSKAELQYKILKTGNGGASPKKSDTVVVRYRGTFINGKEFDIFDDSVKHGDTVTLPMNDVIPGWSEALQMMKVGDKWQLFLPPILAYNDFGPPEIGMYATLIYELELVSFGPPDEKNPPPIR